MREPHSAREKRKHQRKDAALTVEFEIDSKRRVGTTQDLSASGMLLATSTPLEKGCETIFNIKKKKGVIRVLGRIVRVHKEGLRYIAGISFLRIIS
jgi:hypothetical protein